MGDPAHREADVVLRDGSTVRVRPAGPHDAQAVERLLSGVSSSSVNSRSSLSPSSVTP